MINRERHAGFTEICVITADTYPIVRAFTEVGGYRYEAVADSEAGLAQLWRLPPGRFSVRQGLLTAEHDERGRVRLLQIDGLDQSFMRPAARSWDPGGLFDIGIYVRDARASYRALEALGWIAFGQPTDYAWGGFEVTQVVLRGPSSVTLSLMQPRKLPLIELPAYRHWSRAFNAAQVVADYGRSLRFHLDVLGWRMLVDTVVEAVEEPGREILGLPMPWALTQPRPVGIVHPDGGNDGSLEIIGFPGVDGRACGEACRAPNVGMVSARFEVEDAALYRAEVTARGGTPGPLVTLDLSPFGRVLAFAVRSPDGAQFEFFSRTV